MDLSNFIKLIESDTNKISIMVSNKITYSELVKKYKIKSSIFNMIWNSNILKPKFRKERRTFISFLRLYFPPKYKEIEFVNRESPDFKIFKDDKTFYYEIVQAVINPVFEKLLYYNFGKNLNEKDYKKR